MSASEYGESRAVPQSIEAEQALLGACLLDKEALETSFQYVKAEDFYQENHRLIYAALRELAEHGNPCDIVALSAELTKKAQLERIGGLAYLASLTNTVPSTVSAAYYARIISEKALLRAVIRAGGQIAEEGINGTRGAEEMIEFAESTIFRISERKVHQGPFSVGSMISDVFEEMSNIKANEGVTGVPTFRDLDKFCLSGLQRSDLIILAARPAMGKTSMALNIAQNAAVKYGRTVAVFSLEMAKEQLVQRMLCYQARVDQSTVRKGQATSDDISRLADALPALVSAELYIDDTATITTSEIRAKCRKLKMEKKKLDLVVIDYLQLISGGKRSENRQQEISEISRSLKAVAKELDVPVLALSQLSRMGENSKEAPKLSHLRESGAIEQDADVVVFLHQNRDDKENENPSNVTEVIVAKHRNGPVGKVEMIFVPKYTAFENKASDWVAPPPDEE